MSTTQPAFLTIDRGTATAAAGLIGHVGGRWRLLGAAAAPADIADEALAERLRRRLAAVDPGAADDFGLGAAGAAVDLVRLTCTTSAPPELAVVAATDRALQPLVNVAAAAGWRVRAAVVDGGDILGIVALLADRRLDGILAGVSDPASGDERGLLAELGTLVTAAAERRPDLLVVLAGGLSGPGAKTGTLLRAERPGPTVIAPAADADDGKPLRALLDELRGGSREGRRALAVAAGTLATVLHRRIEILEIGQASATRIAAGWQPGMAPDIQSAVVADAALLPRGFGEEELDAVLGWLTTPADRLRVRDRLRDLALAPWSDGAGEGALLRMAAGRAALARLRDETDAFDDLAPPDLVIAAGGCWQSAPAPAVALAMADVMRRPGVRALALDQARILAPLGTISDDRERATILADLRDDLLVPLGSVVLPGGLRGGGVAGSLGIAAPGGAVEIDLLAGGLELVDLAPGETAVLELRFREAVDLGAHARHFAVEVVGGLAGLIVDLRGVPLRLPDRAEPRRELLAGWQSVLWEDAGR